MTPGRPEAFVWSKAPEETTRRGITMLIARICPIFSELSATPPSEAELWSMKNAPSSISR